MSPERAIGVLRLKTMTVLEQQAINQVERTLVEAKDRVDFDKLG